MPAALASVGQKARDERSGHLTSLGSPALLIPSCPRALPSLEERTIWPLPPSSPHPQCVPPHPLVEQLTGSLNQGCGRTEAAPGTGACGAGGWPQVSVSGVPAPKKEGAVRTEPLGVNRWTETPVGTGGIVLILTLFKPCSRRKGK